MFRLHLFTAWILPKSQHNVVFGVTPWAKLWNFRLIYIHYSTFNWQICSSNGNHCTSNWHWDWNKAGGSHRTWNSFVYFWSNPNKLAPLQCNAKLLLSQWSHCSVRLHCCTAQYQEPRSFHVEHTMCQCLDQGIQEVMVYNTSIFVWLPRKPGVNPRLA